jgi:hypothetical protein
MTTYLQSAKNWQSFETVKAVTLKSAVNVVSRYVGNPCAVSTTPHCVKIHDITARNSFANKSEECIL